MLDNDNLNALLGLSQLPQNAYEFGGKAFSTQELWCKISEKINILIEHFKYLDKTVTGQTEAMKLKLDYLLGQGLNEQVSKKILALIADGTLGQMINGTLLQDINTKVDTYKEELISKINTDITEVNTEIDKIKSDIINVKLHPLYNKDDVSIALNDILLKLKQGDTVVLNEDVCNIRSTVKGYLPKDVTLDLNCIFNVIGNIDGFEFNGGVNTVNINIKAIYGDKVNFANFSNSGFKLTGSFSAILNIGDIIGFFKGLNYECINNGIQYVKYRGQNINTCRYAICLDAKDFWVNENTFDCGMLGSFTAIKTFPPTKAPNNDCYNNNRFLHPSFEYVTEKCLDVTNFFNNHISDFRLMEEYPETGIIFNEVKSYGNKYTCTHKVRANQFKLDFESSIEAMVCDDKLTILTDKAISKYQALGETNKLTFRQFNQTVHVPLSISDTLPNRTFEYTKAFETVYYDVGYDHKFIRIPQIYNYEGFQLDVYWNNVEGETNGGLGLKVIDGDNTTQHWLTKGLTRIMFINGEWKFLQLIKIV